MVFHHHFEHHHDQNQDQHQNKSSRRASYGLLPGLPDDLAMQCLARVPSLSLLWRVSASWRAMLSESVFFHSLRVKLGFKPQKWIYALLYDSHSHGQGPGHGYGRSCAGYGAFSWHAYDPVANKWHALPPLPQPVDFQITSPNFIGLTHSVQCASSETKLFMVAGSSRSGARVASEYGKISSPENSIQNQKYGGINSVSENGYGSRHRVSVKRENGHGYGSSVGRALVAPKIGSESETCVGIANISKGCSWILKEIGKNCASEHIHAYIENHNCRCMSSASEDWRCGNGCDDDGRTRFQGMSLKLVPGNEMVNISYDKNSTSDSTNRCLDNQKWKCMNSVMENRRSGCKALVSPSCSWNLPKSGMFSTVEDPCSSTEWQESKCVNSVLENGYGSDTKAGTDGSLSYQGVPSKKITTEKGFSVGFSSENLSSPACRALAKTCMDSASESIIPWIENESCMNSESGSQKCGYGCHVDVGGLRFQEHFQRAAEDFHSSSVGCRSLRKSSKHSKSEKNNSLFGNSTSVYRKRTEAHEAEAGSTFHRRMLVSPGNSGVSSMNIGSEATQRLPLEPALDCPYIFDTEAWTWKLGLPYTVPRRWCACGVVSDGNLIVASGCGKDWDLSVSKSAEMYDCRAGKWIPLENLKSSKFSGEAINAVNFGGKLHMVSGKGVFWKVGVIFDPLSRTWTDMPRGMRDGWNGPSVVVDDKLYVLEDSIGRLKSYESSDDCWISVMEDKRLMNLDQLTSGVSGKLCGIVRATTNLDSSNQSFEMYQNAPHSSSSSPYKQNVVRIVDVSGNTQNRCRIWDVPIPFGQVVALQVLSRRMVDASNHFLVTNQEID